MQPISVPACQSLFAKIAPHGAHPAKTTHPGRLQPDSTRVFFPSDTAPATRVKAADQLHGPSPPASAALGLLPPYHIISPAQPSFPFEMTTTAAQDEFNELLRDKDIDHRHPEDRDDDSDHSEPESTDHDDDYREIIDTDDELEIPVEMRVNYQVPSTRYEANTGPKGVIADAQAFQEAMKLELISKTSHSKPALWKDESTISDEDTEKFLKSWREKRVQELQNMKQRIRSRTISPGRRIYGSIPIVDGPQCLHAIQHTPPTTLLIVVLCLHDYVCAAPIFSFDSISR